MSRGRMAGVLAAIMAGGALAAAEPQLPDLNWTERSDWVNVKTEVSPAAVGDGIADDTAALQAALDLVQTNKYAGSPAAYTTNVIYMPPGTYRITDTLRLRSRHGIAWIGHGRNTRIVWAGPANSVHGMYWSDGVGYCRYVGMVWDGAGLATIGHDHCSTTLYETRVRYEHMAFVNFTITGIASGSDLRSNNSAETMFENCLFTNSSVGASVYAHNQYNYTFKGCEFRDCWGIGLSFGWGSNGRVWDSHFERNALDLYFSGEHGNSARRCTSVGSGQFAWQNAGVAPLTIQDCIVDGWTNTTGAITVNTTPTILFDCVFTHPPSRTAPIQVAANAHVIVSNNKSEETAGIVEAGGGASVTEIPPGARSGSFGSATQSFFRSEASMPGVIFDVKHDFGATGNGTTDDTAAITNAIEAARAYGQGAIAYFPGGQYKVTQTISITGSNYSIGGSVGFANCTRILGYQTTGAIFAVHDPQSIAIQNLTVHGWPLANQTNVCAVRQTSSGGRSSITYDGVCAGTSYWSTEPRPRGFELAGLGTGDVVNLKFVEGEQHYSDCGRATILVQSWIDGQVLVDGTEAVRDGFLGFLFAHDTITSGYCLTVSNNYDLVISEFYQEQSQKNLLLCGAPGEPAGRVTIQGDRINCNANPVINVQNYQGQLCYGHNAFHSCTVQPQILQSGDRPLELIFMAMVSYNNPGNPYFDLDPVAVRLSIIECVGASTFWTNNVIQDGALTNAALSLDDLRELGAMDLWLNYGYAWTNALWVPGPNMIVADADGDWDATNTWLGGVVPAAGNDVLIPYGLSVLLTNSTAVLGSLTNKGTLTFLGTNAYLIATNVAVNGVVTHSNNTATTTNALGQWVADNRVWIVCTNLMVPFWGTIDADARGFGPQCGPGKGGYLSGGAYAGGGAYGGAGGKGSDPSTTPGGVTYGSAIAPSEPGSGGGRPTAGRGGGWIRIEAADRAIVNGVIQATGGNGDGGSGAAAGSGGAVYITCRTFAGTNGLVSANGGGNSSYGCAGGGRIALHYDTTAQAALNLTARPTVTFCANAGPMPYSYSNRGRPGTLWSTDASVFPLGSTSIQGGQFLAPGFASWAPPSLTVVNGMAVFPDGFRLTTTNDLTITGGYDAGVEITNGVVSVGGDLDLNGGKSTISGGLTFGNTDWTLAGALTLSLTNPVVSIPGNLTLNSGGTLIFSALPYSTPQVDIAGNLTLNSATVSYTSAGTNSSSLNVGGNLWMTNTARLYAYGGITNSAVPYGVQVNVTGDVTVASNSWIYAFSNPTNGGSPIFRARNLAISGGTNGGFNATAVGFGGGSGPGHGTLTGSGWAGGGGYGGKGADGSTGVGGSTYGSWTNPIDPGSGGGRPADRAGGLVRIQVEQTLTLNGTINADGTSYSAIDGTGGGGGAGGGIYLRCSTLAGDNATLSANGGSASTSLGGGGGGGRIAIWRVPQYQTANTSAWTVVVNGGTAKSNGIPGTIYWGVVASSAASSRGTVFTSR